MLKKLRFVLPLLLSLGVISCVNQGPTNAPSNFYSSDPVARALGNGVIFSTNGEFDVGVAFQREDNEGTGFYASAAMAFDKDWIPAGANSTTVNGVTLPWLGGGNSNFLPNTFGLQDSALFGATDSMSFGYANFDNEYYGSTVEIAPPFGIAAQPDTVSASKGFTMHYANVVPGDSVKVTLFAFDSVSVDSAVIEETFIAPDTGGVAFPPQALPYSAGGTYLYEIALVREHFTTRISDAGKKIGIYSNYTTQAAYKIKP